MREQSHEFLPADRESGLGMIEVIVAMFLLAIVAVSLLPAFSVTAQLSQKNVLVGRAANVANKQVDTVLQQEQLNPNCSSVTSLALARTQVPDAGSTDFSYSRTVSPCPASYPATMKVTVTVYQGASGPGLASVNTLVAVTGP